MKRYPMLLLTDENGEVLVMVDHIAAIRKSGKADNSGTVLVMGNRSGRITVQESLQEVTAQLQHVRILEEG